MEAKAPEFVLAYDANCGPCSRFKAIVEFLDPRRRINFVSLEVADRLGMLAGIAPARRYASFHFIRPASSDERALEIWSGSEALLPLLRSLSPEGLGILRAIEAAPGGMAGLSFLYSTISRLHQVCPVRPPLDASTRGLAADGGRFG